MSKLCPNCRIPMELHHIHGIEYDVCPECAGIWFDQGELGKARAASINSLSSLETNHSPSATAVPHPAIVKACPNDLTSLTTYRYSASPEVDLDHCPNCGGVWVEENELGKMDLAFRKRLDRTPIADEASQELGIFEAEQEGVLDHEQRVQNVLNFWGQRHLWPGL